MGKDRKANLIANINFIQTIFPEFKVSEEQIELYLSKEREQLHDSVQGQKSYFFDKEEYSAERKSILAKYDSSKTCHKAVARNIQHMVKEEKTPDDAEFNKRMFSGINRDDEIGDAVRLNYYVEALNKNFELDPEEILNCDSQEDLVKAAQKYGDIGGIAMETYHFMADFPELKLKPELSEKLKKTRDYGEAVGAFLRDYVHWVQSDLFLEFPVELIPTSMLEEMVSKKEFSNKYGNNFANFIANEKQRRELKDECKAFISGVPDYKDFRFKVDDVEFALPQNARYKGGFEVRRQAILEGCERILNSSCSEETEMFAEVQDRVRSLKDLIIVSGDIPSEENQKLIADMIEAQNKQIYKFTRRPAISKSTDPAISELKKLCSTHSLTSSPFKSVDYLGDLIKYHKADRERYNEKAAPMLNSLKELNDVYSYLRSKDEYGRQETLTQLDIYDIRVRQAEIVKIIDDTLVNDATLTEFDKRNMNAIRQQVLSQQKAIDRAVPGMTIDRALDGRAREIDISGHQFKIYGNAMSSRKRMTISGEDGSRVNGFFTEHSTLSEKDFAQKMISNLASVYPKYEEYLGEYVNAIVSGTEYATAAKAFFNKDAKITEADTSAIYNFVNNAHEDFIGSKATMMGMLNCTDDTVVDQRNVAMSDVAILLGCEYVLAKSTPLTLYDNGRKIQGTFMDTAKGYNPDYIEKGSPFLDVKADCLDNSPALKQIADLQVLDYICGNVDRHAGNIMYEFDENGKIIGIKGIDNDLSFSSYDMPSGKLMNLSDISYVSASMAARLSKITPEMLRTSLAGNNLNETEISRACERLMQLKSALDPQKGSISVMADEEFEKHKLDDFIPQNQSKECTFSMVKTKVQTVINMSQEKRDEIINAPDEAKQEDDVLDLFEHIETSQLKQDINPLDKLITDVEAAEKKVFFGSTEFDNVKKVLQSIKRGTDQICSEKKPLNNKMAFVAIHDAYKELEKLCVKYIKHKKDQGKLEAGGKDGRRISAVNKVKEFCINKIESLGKALGLDPNVLDNKAMKEEAERIQLEAMDPKTAGALFKQMNIVALDSNASSYTKIKAAEQIKLISRYMQENDLTREDCGLDKKDFSDAQKVLKAGRSEKIRLHPELKQQGPDELKKAEPEMKL